MHVALAGSDCACSAEPLLARVQHGQMSGSFVLHKLILLLQSDLWQDEIHGCDTTALLHIMSQRVPDSWLNGPFVTCHSFMLYTCASCQSLLSLRNEGRNPKTVSLGHITLILMTVFSFEVLAGFINGVKWLLESSLSS